MRFLRQSLPCLSYSVEQLLNIFTKSHVILAKECTCCCNMPLDLAISNLRRLKARLRPPASAGNEESKQNSCPLTGERNSENLHSCLERKPCARRVTHCILPWLALSSQKKDNSPLPPWGDFCVQHSRCIFTDHSQC